jgi:hypothetical protein
MSLRINDRSVDAGVTQLVECNLAKVDVEGSNPFARSTFLFFLKSVFRSKEQESFLRQG